MDHRGLGKNDTLLFDLFASVPGVVQERASTDLRRLVPLLLQDPVLDVSDTLEGLLITSLQTFIRIQQYAAYFGSAKADAAPFATKGGLYQDICFDLAVTSEKPKSPVFESFGGLAEKPEGVMMSVFCLPTSVRYVGVLRPLHCWIFTLVVF